MKSFAKTTTFLTTLLVLVPASICLADPPPGGQPGESQGGMLTSLKQALGENLDREEVRGRFDVGTPPDSRRYYCLVDPKTGKREPNGVSGEAVQRRDGTTGIKSAVVSPLSCADAEQKGMLVTADYKLMGKAVTAASPSAPASTPPSPAPVATSAAPAAVPAAAVAPRASPPIAGEPPDDSQRREVMGVFARFIVAQNVRDSAALAEVLLDSKDFLWVPENGAPIWGYQAALAAFEQTWKGAWRLDPQAQGSRVAELSSGVRVLVTPLLRTSEAAPRDPPAHRLEWSGVFVETPSGWRIASIFVTALGDSRAAH